MSAPAAPTGPAASSGPILALDELTVEFGHVGQGGSGTVAVDRVSIAIEQTPPRLLSIVGESGSGKTTVARSLLGLQPPTRGRALYRGQDIYRLDKKEMTVFRREVQAIFQDPYGIYNPYYRINRVFDMAIKKFKLASSKGEKQDLIEEALRAVNLRPPDVLGRYPHQLSGGERQRVMLARAYLLRPKVIIADEPISMLDVAVRATIMNILLDFKEQYGVSTLFITHDLSAAYYLGGDIMVMARGRVVEEGRSETVMDQPAHPYTQLLLQSIPSPDPDQRWGEVRVGAAGPISLEQLVRRDRCLFAERCPYVMEMCWQARPPGYGAGEQRASCYLHRPEAPVAASVVMDEIPASSEPAAVAG
ncbi:MAG: ABC transporter ATP-binding protein [Thermomicrobiales bacterium]